MRNRTAGALVRWAAFSAVMLLGVFSGCASMDPAAETAGCPCFKKASDAKEQTVSVGQTFRIELASNPTTGYDWYIVSLDKQYFEVVKDGYDPAKPQRTGSGGTRWWEIRTLKSGTSTVALRYYRVWEGPDKAVDKYELRVQCKQN